MYLSLFLCVSLCLYVSLYLSLFLFLFVSLYVSLSMCLSLNVSLYVSLSKCLSLCVSLPLSLSFSLSLSLSPSLQKKTDWSRKLFCIERGEIFIARLKMVLTPRKHKQTEEKNSNQSCKKTTAITTITTLYQSRLRDCDILDRYISGMTGVLHLFWQSQSM